ncbi:MAG: PH domain-containing protein [Anaerolineae bacterium]|nr:PH domain-containing protein [Anaerolineae bacterium]
MDVFTKRFVRDWIVVGFPAGFFYGINIRWDAEWYYKIIGGLVFGSLLGLPYAFSNGVSYGKPLFRKDFKNGKAAGAKGVPDPAIFKTPFMTLNNMFWLGLLGFIWIATITGMYGVFEFTPEIIFVGFLLLYVLAALTVLTVRMMRAKVVLSKKGMEYHGMLRRITVRWNQVRRLERRGGTWRLVCRETEMKASLLMRILLTCCGDDLVIPLHQFGKDLPGSELLEGIRQYVPEIELYSTR